jgi:hypothetical protein
LWRSCSPAATPIRRSIPPDRRTAARTIPAAIPTIPPATRRTTSGSAAKSRRATAGRGGDAFVGRHRSVWVFLGPPHFGGNPQFRGIGIPWISLDSLVRIATYQWVARDFPRKFFREPGLGARSWKGSRDRGHSEGRDVHGARLIQFRIVSNQLSSDPVEHASSLLIRGARGLHRRLPNGRTNRMQGVVHLMLFSAYAQTHTRWLYLRGSAL